MSSFERNRIRGTEDSHYRSLWGAVVLQAKADIESEPLTSIEFAQAVAFFLASVRWANTRTSDRRFP